MTTPWEQPPFWELRRGGGPCTRQMALHKRKQQHEDDTRRLRDELFELESQYPDKRVENRRGKGRVRRSGVIQHAISAYRRDLAKRGLVIPPTCDKIVSA